MWDAFLNWPRRAAAAGLPLRCVYVFLYVRVRVERAVATPRVAHRGVHQCVGPGRELCAVCAEPASNTVRFCTSPLLCWVGAAAARDRTRVSGDQ